MGDWLISFPIQNREKWVKNYRLECQYLCLLNQIFKTKYFFSVNKYNPDSNQSSCMSATYCKFIWRGNSLLIWKDHCSILAGKPAPSEYSTYTNSISLVASTRENKGFFVQLCFCKRNQSYTGWDLLRTAVFRTPESSSSKERGHSWP